MGEKFRALTRREFLAATGATFAAYYLKPVHLAWAGPASSDVLTIAQGADIVTMDQDRHRLLHNFSVISGVAEKLVAVSRRPGEIDGVLATSWESATLTRWRFRLRPGVKFHNGVEFTAEAAKFSLDRGREGIWRDRLAPIDRVNVVDKYTIDIITKFPYPLLPYQLNVAPVMIEPGWATSAQWSEQTLVGTGPYRFVEWIRGQRVVMDNSREYWRGARPYRRVVWRPVSENTTRVAGLLAGELDLIRQIPPQDLARIRARSDLRLATVSSNRAFNIRIRTDRKPFDDVRVRQALNYAVDKEAIVRAVLGGLGVVLAGQYSGPNTRGWHPGLKPYPYDPEKARSLLRDAGHPRGFTTAIDTPRGVTFQDFEVSQAVAGMLARVGIECEVILNETGEYSRKFGDPRAETAPLFFASSGNIVPDFENTLADLLRERVYMYRSQGAQQLFERLQRTLDEDARIRIAREGAELIREDAPIIFLCQQVDAYGVKAWVDWTPRADEHIYLHEVGRRG